MSTKPTRLSFKRLANILFFTQNGHGSRTRYTVIILLSVAVAATLALPALGASPPRVAILPFQIHSAEDLGYLKAGIFDIISSRLTASGEIDVIGKSGVERVLIEMRPSQLSEEVAREAGVRLKADYVALGSITKIGDFISLDARLIDVGGQKPPSGVFAQTKGLDQLMGKVDEFARELGQKILGKPVASAKSGEPTAKTPFIVRPREGPILHGKEAVGFQRSQKFPFEIKGLDIADVDGDGQNEIVVMDRHTLWIYKYVEEKLRLFTKLRGRAEQDFLTLDVADVNGNGTAEIFVTSVSGEDLTSFILEYEEDRFKKISDRDRWYFRVLDLPEKGPTLLGQKMGSEESFSGSIYQFSWKGKKFGKGKKLKLPKETPLFGLAIADITGDGRQEILRFDYADHLRVLSADGKDTLYKTPSSYGGSSTFFDRESIPEVGRRDGTEPGKRVYLQGRIVVLDLDGDGRVEVIVNKNHFATGQVFQRVRMYDMSEVYDLVWDGMMLAENWRTREIPGYIADYQVEDFDNDGKRELVVAMVSPSQILERSGESQILFFELF